MTSILPYGAKGRELLLELKRSEWLPAYNGKRQDDGVRQVLGEIDALYKRMRSRMAESRDMREPFYGCPLMVYHASTLRNKRCLLAYLKYRADLIGNLRWDAGSAIPEDLRRKLCAEEAQYFSAYDNILSDYMREVDLDLAADMEPPKNLYVEVRVLRDCGEIDTVSGPVVLAKDTTHNLRRSDVEHLIRQGALEQVTS
ncbi:DNA replication complex GINS protein PSF1 [Hondaea fermentalgiana]|uniref:DNA replication complex GINS protein PSF1 n=1 Tax=Hondaea fermentalgiana TaxID=2315210 RepID=A0A2R5GNH7_9STRA|nr:DNA replication complex GINS protein PSF1 [Hondaea fermentalgiana]|eukprot:GBG32447.1 DNA replication complex GINS protein PSF1 [Hondaea fermentalgiana]